MPRRAIARGARRSIGSPSNRTRPAVARRTPVIRSNSVLLPAPLGPISATVSASPTVKLTSSTATSPPKVLRAFSSTSSGPACTSAGRGAVSTSAAGSILRAAVGRQPERDQRPYPLARILQNADQHDSEQEILEHAEPAEHVLNEVLQDDYDAGTEQGSEHLADAADNRHQQIVDIRLG